MAAACGRTASPEVTVAVAGTAGSPRQFTPPVSPGVEVSEMGVDATEGLAGPRPPSPSTEVPVVAMGAAVQPPVRVPFGPGQPPPRTAQPPLPLSLDGKTVDLRATLDMVLRMGLQWRAERRELVGRAAADQAFAAIDNLLDAYERNDFRLDGE